MDPTHLSLAVAATCVACYLLFLLSRLPQELGMRSKRPGLQYMILAPLAMLVHHSKRLGLHRMLFGFLAMLFHQWLVCQQLLFVRPSHLPRLAALRTRPSLPHSRSLPLGAPPSHPPQHERSLRGVPPCCNAWRRCVHASNTCLRGTGVIGMMHVIARTWRSWRWISRAP